MTTDLDTLLIALYVELTDCIIPARGLGRRGPDKPPEVTDAKLVCLAVAQVLLRFDDERHWLRAAPRLVGDLFPRRALDPCCPPSVDRWTEMSAFDTGRLMLFWYR